MKLTPSSGKSKPDPSGKLRQILALGELNLWLYSYRGILCGPRSNQASKSEISS